MKVTLERLRTGPRIGPGGDAFRLCRHRIWRAAVGLLAITSPLFGQPVVYVDDNVTGANDGSTWEDAYVDLQDALDHAATSGGRVSEIWVAAGTYRPTKLTNPADPRSATFQPLNGVGLYGGFAGWETERDQRDPTANETVALPVMDRASFGTPRDLPTPRQYVHNLDFLRQESLDLGRTFVPASHPSGEPLCHRSN